MRILGIDIGNGFAVCCPLDAQPTEPRQFNIDGANFFSFPADIAGIKGILELKPDLAVLEPTGTNYSKLWVQHLTRAGIEVRLVAHHRLKAQRDSLGLPDKDDQSDSFALAYYGWHHLNDSTFFIQIKDKATARLREIVLRLAHLNRCQNPILNRLRQDLAWQFPERARKKITRNETMRNPPGFLRWLAGEKKILKYENEYKNSVGLGLTESTRLHALRLCDIHREELTLEDEAIGIIKDEKFDLYRRCFNAFGFGLRTQIILISQIYPFEAFLNEDKKPIIVFKKGKNSGKITKRHISRRRFEKNLGTAPTRNASGAKDLRQVIGGSGLSRQLLTGYVSGQCTKHQTCSKNIVKEAIRVFRDSPLRTKGKKQHSTMNTACHLSRLIFKALNSMINDQPPDLIHFETIKVGGRNYCSYCGRESTSHCDHCQRLKNQVKQHFKSFLP